MPPQNPQQLPFFVVILRQHRDVMLCRANAESHDTAAERVEGEFLPFEHSRFVIVGIVNLLLIFNRVEHSTAWFLQTVFKVRQLIELFL